MSQQSILLCEAIVIFCVKRASGSGPFQTLKLINISLSQERENVIFRRLWGCSTAVPVCGVKAGTSKISDEPITDILPHMEVSSKL